MGAVGGSLRICLWLKKPKIDADLDWLTFWLKAINLRELNKAAAVPGLNREDAYSIEIPLPPLPEQRRIAALLNEQMETVEKARTAAQVQLEAAKALPAAYLRAVFNSPEAQEWPRDDLSEMCDLLPAKSIALNGDFEGDIITTACLTESGFQPSGIRKARMWKEDFEKCVVSLGEVLIARSNTIDLVGRVAMYSGNPKGVAATDLTIRLWPKDPLKSQFLTSYLSFLYLSGYWKDHASGAPAAR